MRIVKPYAVIMSQPHPVDEGWSDGLELAGRMALNKIEWCSRISHRSEDKVTEDSWKRIIQSVVMDHGDWSVVEHVSVSVDFLVDRGITHEIVRHRLFSYTQESTRFVNYEKKMPPSFIYPKPEVECIDCISGSNDTKAFIDVNDNSVIKYRHYDEHDHGDNIPKLCKYDFSWLHAIETVETKYKLLLAQGWRPQEARSVFPNALASRLIMTGNLRSWRHFFVMRTTAEAHPQMRQVTIPLLKEFQEVFPLLYDDIVPNKKQSESMRSPR